MESKGRAKNGNDGTLRALVVMVAASFFALGAWAKETERRQAWLAGIVQCDGGKERRFLSWHTCAMVVIGSVWMAPGAGDSASGRLARNPPLAPPVPCRSAPGKRAKRLSGT